MKVKHNKSIAQKRKERVRSKITGTTLRPRLSVFRSNQHIYLQVIDDSEGKTLVSANDRNPDLKKKVAGKKKMEVAQVVTEVLAEKMKTAKIEKIVFDRGGYRYHGRVKMIADLLRDKGIQF